MTALPADIFDELTQLKELNLSRNELTTLPTETFDGLTQLKELFLFNNALTTLPEGIFDDLTALTWLWLSGNTVDPLPLTVSFEKVAEGQFKAVAPTGAPFAFVLPVSVSNGSIARGPASLTIPRGNVESKALTVTRTSGTTDAVTIDIGSLPDLPPDTNASGLPLHRGYELVKSTDLPLEVISAIPNRAPTFTESSSASRTVAENTQSGVDIGDPVSATDPDNDTLTYTLSGTDAASFDIVSSSGQLRTDAPLDYETKDTYTVIIIVSDENLTDTITVDINVTDVSSILSERTSQVRDAIVAVAPGVSSEDEVTAPHLSVIRELDLSNQSITTLQADDFDGLLRLATLNLSDNALHLLPSRLFDDPTALVSLTLLNNQIENLRPLSKLRNLQRLDAANNAIVDVSLLSSLTDLTELDLKNNQITDVLPLAGLRALTELSLDGNTGITNPEVLYKLEQGGTAITGVTIPDVVAFEDDNLEAAVKRALKIAAHLPILLTEIPTLPALTVSRKGITDLTGLETATGLTSLTLSNNEITDVFVLKDLTRLERLDLRNNQITDVLPLVGLMNLTSLTLTGNPVLNPGVLFRLKQSGTTITGVTIPDAVVFPDTALESAVRSALSLSDTEPILPHVLAGLTTLSASNLGIVDLTGLEHATGLTVLTLAGNQIIDVLPLVGLTYLTQLDLTGNPITNPGVLFRLKQDGTTITGVTIPDAIDFPDTALGTAVRKALKVPAGSPILPDTLAVLTRLTASRQRITDLTGLEHATGLERLDLGQNENITDVSALENLIRLENLDLADNQITDVSVLSSLTRLEVLDLRDNDVTDTALLSTMTHLKNLYVRGNENLSSLKELVRLKEAGTRVDITLPKAVNVPDVNLAAALRTALNALPTLTLQPDDPIFPEDMELLTTLTASGESIVTLTGLETATALTSLTLNDNAIANLTPLAKLVNLEALNLANNEKISSISSLAKLTALTTLNLSNNKISSVSSLSKLTSLTDLNLSMNQISSLTALSDLSSLTNFGSF